MKLQKDKVMQNKEVKDSIQHLKCYNATCKKDYKSMRQLKLRQ